MKLAFSTLGCPQWGPEQILEAARTEGYHGVELRFLQGSLDLADVLAALPGGPGGLRRRFEEAGVAICCLDSSLVLTAPESDRQQAEQMLDLARQLGAPYLRVFGGDVPDGEPFPACLRRAAGKLADFGRLAAQRGLRVLVETHDAFSAGARIAELLAATGPEGTGALWDLHHPFHTGEAPAETARLIGTQTHHVHVKDAASDGRLCLLGEGQVPLRELVGELGRLGYQGYLSLEWEKAWHPELADPEVALPHAAG